MVHTKVQLRLPPSDQVSGKFLEPSRVSILQNPLPRELIESQCTLVPLCLAGILILCHKIYVYILINDGQKHINTIIYVKQAVGVSQYGGTHENKREQKPTEIPNFYSNLLSKMSFVDSILIYSSSSNRSTCASSSIGRSR